MNPIKHTCKTCGREFNGKKDRKYCCRECYLKAPRGEAWNKGTVGVSTGRPKTGVEIICKHCGKKFYEPHCYNYAQFCSMSCYHLHRWGGSRVEARLCVICGAPFNAKKSMTNKTCSGNCAEISRRRNMSGEKSHLWRGGKTAPYHSEWRERRREARERDGNKCTICGSEDRLQVHHVIPYRYSKSHDLSNLVTLCRSCHSRAEILVNKSSRDGLKKRWPCALGRSL